MRKQEKEKMVHVDVIGREIKTDDYVSALNRRSLVVAKVTKLAPKMLRLQELNSVNKFNRYASEVTLLLPLDDVMFHVLKNKK